MICIVLPTYFKVKDSRVAFSRRNVTIVRTSPFLATLFTGKVFRVRVPSRHAPGSARVSRQYRLLVHRVRDVVFLLATSSDGGRDGLFFVFPPRSKRSKSERLENEPSRMTRKSRNHHHLSRPPRPSTPRDSSTRTYAGWSGGRAGLMTSVPENPATSTPALYEKKPRIAASASP